MGQYQSIYNGSQIDDCVSQAVRTIVQQLTDAQKSQVRTNIGAGTYSIPSGGIPRTSLTTDVQTSLSKADNALPLSGGTISGSLSVTGTISSNSKVSGKSCQFGYVEIPTNQNVIESLSGYDLYLNYYRNANILICYGGGNCGVGTSSPSYKLHVAGTVGATGFTNTSDIRNKNIVGNVNLKIKDIADAPIFKFTWLDKEIEQGVNVGTSAQYWNMVLPEIVTEANDEKRTLSMQYDVAGLISSVVLAKRVVEQEETIKLQDTRIKELEKIVDEIQSKLDKQKL